MRKSTLVLALPVMLLFLIAVPKGLAQETVVQTSGALELERIATFTLDPDGNGLFRNELKLLGDQPGGELWEGRVALKSGHTDEDFWGCDEVVWETVDRVLLRLYLKEGELRQYGYEYRANWATKTPSCWLFSSGPRPSGGPYGTLIVTVRLPEGATLISANPTPDEVFMDGTRPCVRYREYDSMGFDDIQINYSTRECEIPEFGTSPALVGSVALLLLLPLRKKLIRA